MLLRPAIVLFPFLPFTIQEEAPGEIPLQKVEEALREHSADRYTLMYAFAAQKNAPGAIPSLLGLMKNQAPKLDNDICLGLLRILKTHPTAKCPLDPLLDVVRRRIWNSQQKGSLVLFQALREREAWKGREEEINAALIPLMTSQRSRVYEAALKCLETINDKHLGPDPDAWKDYYEKTYPGKSLDLGKALYELLAVIHPSSEEPFSFEVNGEKGLSADDLTQKLGDLSHDVRQKGLTLEIVIQTSGEITTAEGEYPPGVKVAIQAVTNYFVRLGESTFRYTVSPGTDIFRAPYNPKARQNPKKQY
jgi:hypothetical protein